MFAREKTRMGNPMRKKTRAPEGTDPDGSGDEDLVDLRLYVTDRTPRCLAAYENIRRICEEHVHGAYRITVIDLLRNPGQARTDDITAIPTLVRLPRTVRGRKIIGMLTDTGKVVDELDLEKRIAYQHQGTIRKMAPPT